jgi:hypothetical protein
VQSPRSWAGTPIEDKEAQVRMTTRTLVTVGIMAASTLIALATVTGPATRASTDDTVRPPAASTSLSTAGQVHVTRTPTREDLVKGWLG